MTELSEEEQRRILEASPRAIWVLALVVGAAMLACWLYLLFGQLPSQGPLA